MLLVLAVVLASLWAAGLAGTSVGDPANQSLTDRSLPGISSAVLPDRAPSLRPPVERLNPLGRSVPLLLGLLAASVVAAYGVPARRRRSRSAPARSLVLSAPRGPRAPPRLQTA